MGPLLVVIVLLLAQARLAFAGWGSGKGWTQRGHNSYYNQSNGHRWQSGFGGQPQTVRVEIDHVRGSASRKRRKSKKDKRHDHFESSSESESSSSPHKHGRKRPSGFSDKENARLQSELETLRKEKADREAADRKQELMAEVRAITAEIAGKFQTHAPSQPAAKEPSNQLPGASKPVDSTALMPAEKMAVFHSLDGYVGVKSAKSWAELEETLANEDEGVLKDLFRKVSRRGGLPKSDPAMARKLVIGLQSSIAEFAEQ